jgi:nucleoside-diphosphate-sugar epimerase
VAFGEWAFEQSQALLANARLGLSGRIIGYEGWRCAACAANPQGAAARIAAIRLLVTGNQGFIGPVLTRMARARGHHVTGLDVGYFADCIAGPEPDAPPDRQIQRDIREASASDLEGIEAIVHLAGLSNDPMGELNPRLTHDINVGGTLRLAELAKAAGVPRFVFASSCSIYGAAGGAVELDETAALDPVSAYAVSKADAEAGLAALADANFAPVFMRNATAFGLGVRPRFDLVVNNLAGWANATKTVRVMSDGTPWRPLAHIEDISQAALCAAEAPAQIVRGRAFNIGRTDANYQVSQIAETICEAFPQARLEITGESGGDPRSYRVDFGRALRELPGFAPQWTLARGVDEAARWLKDGGLRDSAFDSRLFIRLKQLRHELDQGRLDAELRRIIAPG